VPGEFGIDIRAHIRRAGDGGIVKLIPQLGGEDEGEGHFSSPYKLLRVFDSEAPGKLVVGMKDRAEGASAGVVDAYVNVSVLAYGQSEVGRHWRKAGAIRR